MEDQDSRRKSPGRGARARPKEIHTARGFPGHTHFWERALSRRQFIQTTGAAAGALVLGSSAWTPAWAKPHDATPKPIPGGFPFTFSDGSTEFFHNLAPGVFDPVDADPSGIFDFDGDIGYAVVDGTGTGRDPDTQAETPLFYEVDLRFMRGKYIGEDGRHHHNTFCLI